MAIILSISRLGKILQFTSSDQRERGANAAWILRGCRVDIVEAADTSESPFPFLSLAHSLTQPGEYTLVSRGAHGIEANLQRLRILHITDVSILMASTRAYHRTASNSSTVKALLTHKISALITHTPKAHIPQQLLDFPIRKFAMLLVGQVSVCLTTHMLISSNVRHAGLSQGLCVMRASTRISYMG